MKKLIIRLIMIVLVGCLLVGGYYIYLGYGIYEKCIEEKSIEQRVNELRSKEDFVKLEEIAPIYQELVIASEDKRFYQHGPVDYRGLARAVITNLTSGSFKEGGSTLTQQLAKNLCLSFEKKIERKIAEVFIAWKLEQNYTKDEILEMYLNITYLGEGNYGIKAACNYYYDIDPVELNEQQAKELVKTLKAPSVYNPSKIKE